MSENENKGGSMDIREQFCKDVKECLHSANWTPNCAYFTDDLYLSFCYENQDGIAILDNKSFGYWRYNVLVGKLFIEHEYEDVLREIGEFCSSSRIFLQTSSKFRKDYNLYLKC